MWARLMNVLVGAWLFVAPSVLRAYPSDRLLGVLIAGVALVSLAAPAFRYVNAVLGVVVFLTPFLFGDGAGPYAAWHQYLVGALVVAFAVAGREPGTGRRPPFSRTAHQRWAD